MTPAELLSRLESLPQAIDSAIADCGSRAVDLIHEGFDQQCDPYGSPWKTRKDFTRVFQNRDHLDFRNSFTVTAHHMGFTVRSSHPAAVFQHHGTEHIPARPVVPTEEKGLPREWEKQFSDIVTAAIKQHLG